MKWEEFINITGQLPVIETVLLQAGKTDSEPVEVQFSRWVKAGKLIQLRRGFYLLAAPYRKIELFNPYIAAVLVGPSYISMEKALEFHGLIPEAVHTFSSVTTKRPCRFDTKVGVFEYNHIKNSLFWGYNTVTLSKQTAFIASPEKAILDFFYLRAPKITDDYLEELRLQNTEKIDLKKFIEYAEKFKKPYILKAAELTKKHIELIRKGEKPL